VNAASWEDTKKNTHRIDWKTPDGTPYTLQGPDVNNGQGYEAALPGRQIIGAGDVPSGSHVYFSGAGNDFGCVPEAGHNLDLALPQLAQVPAGTPITLTFKSRFDIEWDFDYGFVMTTTDSGKTYTSLPSENGYTTPSSQNPNQAGCQAKYGNGITGSGPSYDAGTAPVDRILGNYGDPAFVDDAYDLSAYAGQATTLRFSYATDPGLARPGWFIDDVTVTAGNQVIYSSDLETANDPAFVNGGCAEGGLRTAQICTDGWTYVTGGQASAAEHGYLLEMRDRSGFDADGHGEDDRGAGPTFSPGVLLTYTDEAHGYGNAGTDDPPAQSPIDSQPEPGEIAPNLDDAAYTAASGDSSFTDSGEGHIDNYTDPSRDDGLWRFDYKCLTMAVTRLAGDDIGPPAQGSYNLNGDATFDLGAGCAQFNFGGNVEGPANGKPTAVAQAKPEKVQAGETVTFDGSGSFDDVDAPENLKFAWEFDDGDKDKGRETNHVYTNVGTYKARLTVTDSSGQEDSARVEVKVVASKENRCKGLKGTVVGTAKGDRLKGTKKRDVIIGLAGKDKIDGGRGRDVICGKGGDDKRLSGGEKNDKVFGGGGKDRAGGGPGRDLVNGGAGKDRLSGGGGTDRVVGGPGRDSCAGTETRDRTQSCERAV
jgi:Ca2+-binding RTX toxin-like protein